LQVLFVKKSGAKILNSGPAYNYFVTSSVLVERIPHPSCSFVTSSVLVERIRMPNLWHEQW
jgi:hypothetical protein